MSKVLKYTALASSILGVIYLVDQKLFCRFTISEKAKLSELPFTFNQFTKRQCYFHLENGRFGNIEEIHFQNQNNNLFNYHSDKSGLLKATVTQEINSCKQSEYFTIEITKECKHKINTFSNPNCLETLSEISELFRPKS